MARLHNVLHILLLACLAGSAAIAQDVVRVTITPDVRGVMYSVDGQRFYTSSTFTWPTGSKHLLEYHVLGCNGNPAGEAGLQYDFPCTTRFKFVNWDDGGGSVVRSTVFAYSAHPSLSNVQLKVLAEDRIRVGVTGPELEQPSSIPFTGEACMRDIQGAGGSGVACVDEFCYYRFATIWRPRGKTLSLRALPFSGFAARGWSAGPVQSDAAAFLYTVVGAADLVPLFTPAHRVQIFTEPPGMKVLVDRAEIQTIAPTQLGVNPTDCTVPGRFDFVPGSVHLLSANSPQVGSDYNRYVFDSWSIGGTQNTLFRAGEGNTSQTLIARFVRGVGVRIVVPAGLKAIVDGRDNWPELQFIWPAGSKHVITAPAEQFDAAGRKYIFKGWSNGGSATQELTIGADAVESGLTLSAQYEKLAMVVVQSNMAPVKIDVDGAPCATPCTVHTPVDKPVRLNAAPIVPVRDGERLEFQGWTDGAPRQRTVTPGAEPVIVSAKYDTTFRLTALAEPTAAAELRLSPATSDGWYPFNARVQAFATGRTGFKFRSWSGDTTGSFSPATVVMGGPRTVVANYDPVPHIVPSGVRSAADPNRSAVAAGSLVSIFGGMLASRTDQASATSPLPQRLAGTLVEVEGAFLPLMMVSPQQINAQLPSGLTDGDHTLTIRGPDLSEPVQTTFNVVRNGPGLFSTPAEGDTSRAVASTADGTPVSDAHPVRTGDIVTLLGTGFGPSRVAPPEGFGVGERTDYALIDPVEVSVGGVTVQPIYAGAGAGMPGVITVRFRVPASISAGLQDIFVRVGTEQSNIVKLPVQPTAIKTEE